MDFKNAFKTVNWKQIKSALADIRIYGNLASLFENYVSGSTFWHEMDEVSKEYTIAKGALKDWVIGPMQWNVRYNGLLAIPG